NVPKHNKADEKTVRLSRPTVISRAPTAFDLIVLPHFRPGPAGNSWKRRSFPCAGTNHYFTGLHYSRCKAAPLVGKCDFKGMNRIIQAPIGAFSPLFFLAPCFES